MNTKERRIELNTKLRSIIPNVYFQPPANVSMVYPCIVYHKAPPKDSFANDQTYISKQKYTLTVMDRDPDTTIPESIKQIFLKNIQIVNYATVSGLNHIYLELYY